jgi:hypothetical protein
VKSWLVIFVAACIGAIVVTHVWFPQEPEPLWIETRATQIHVGPWVADIPPGWRDVHELVRRIPTVDVPNARVLLDERFGPYGEIIVFPSGPIGGDQCQEIAKAIDAEGKAHGTSVERAQSATFDGDKGCMIELRMSGRSGLLVTRSRGMFGVGVRCAGTAGGFSTGGPCERLVYSLRVGE